MEQVGKKEKDALLLATRQEALKLKLPVNRCSNDWFIYHLVYESWGNKSKYKNKKPAKCTRFVLSYTLLFWFFCIYID